MNSLYYGDNLDVLARYVKDDSVDLVYLDPPFNSNQDYNILFAEHGARSGAQIQAFEDTWEWNLEVERAYTDAVERGGKVSEVMRAFMTFLGTSDMMAYLCMMAPRLVELRRVMKPTASIYLHCDPTASHYLKMLMDAVFGPQRLLGEIIWQRSSAHNDTAQGLKQPGRIHDVLLFYRKGDVWTWNPIFIAYSEEYLERRFKNEDERGRYKDADLSAARPGGDTSYEWRVRRKRDGEWMADLYDEWQEPREGWEYKGVPPPSGRYWAYSKDNMRRFATENRLHYFSTGMPRLKQYVQDMLGVALQDIWTDIPPINARAQERLGYPTQKPEALLDRIIRSSSNEGDVVLDPFCGCGTAIAVAQRLNRPWIGIDITHLAVNLIKRRLYDAFGDAVKTTYSVIGEPKDHAGAVALAEQDKYQFQWWALGLVQARPADGKKGADRGIDGRLYFHDEKTSLGKTKQIIISVKGGGTSVKDVRDLVGVLSRENAEIGVLISLQEPTREMKRDAAEAGFYSKSDRDTTVPTRHPRVQLLTIAELLAGKGIDYPRTRAERTFKQAPRAPGALQAAEPPPTLPLDPGETITNPPRKRRKGGR